MPPNQTIVPTEVLAAVDRAAVGVLAFRDQRGRPLAWPVTPYRDRGLVVVTSTLAYIRKAEHLRRDNRVALLAGGVLLTGRARVRADVSGRRFVARLLPQELRKYPPTRRMVRVPFHRLLWWWYFGRVLIAFAPATATAIAGDDTATLITLGQDGMPVITPIALTAPPPDAAFPLPSPDSASAAPPMAGPAAILFHREGAAMDDLRSTLLRGRVRNRSFIVRSRLGSLDPSPPAPPGSWWDRLRGRLMPHRRAVQAWRETRGWRAEDAGAHGAAAGD